MRLYVAEKASCNLIYAPKWKDLQDVMLGFKKVMLSVLFYVFEIFCNK